MKKHIKWRKGQWPPTAWSPIWEGVIDGEVVAEIVRTGRYGADDYPWDWSLTMAGRQMVGGYRGGVADALKNAKMAVDHLLGQALTPEP